MKKTSNKNLIIMLIVFSIMLIFTWLTPLCGDDYIYSFNDSSRVRPLNFYDIYQNMKMQREYVTARVVSHFLVQLFLMMPKYVFNFVNAIIFALSLVMLHTYCLRGESNEKGNKASDTLLLITGFFAIWIFMPAFGQIYFWLDGSINYGWAIALILLFLLPFYSYLVCENYNLSIICKILLGIEALILGSYSENGSLAAIGIAACILLYCFISKKRLPSYLIVNLALAVVGYMFLLSAPVLQMKTTEESNSVKYFLVFSCVMVTFGILAFLAMKKSELFKFGPVVSAIVLILFFAFIYEDSFREIFTSPAANLAFVSCTFFSVFTWGIYKKIDRKTLFFSYILFMAGICSIAIFAFAIYLPARSCCYYTVFLILSCMIILQKLDFKVLKVFTIVIAVIFCIAFILGADDIISVGKQNLIRMEEISRALDNGEKEVYLDKFDLSTKYSAQFGIDDIDVNPEECWINRYMADYYYLDFIYAK